MSWFWIVLVTITSVIIGTSLCFYLLRQATDIELTHRIVEHIACPIIRILILIIIVSQIYPVISDGIDSTGFWRVIFQQNNINHIINVLFFGSLVLAFLPVVSHPIFSLPIQSCLTVALVFNWQYVSSLEHSIIFLPGISVWAKIILYMAIAYFVTREVSLWLSRLLDRVFHISGSVRLVADAIYLVLQIPVIGMYCAYLKAQLPIS